MLQPSVSLYLCTCFEALLVVLVLLDLVNVAALLLLLVGQQLPLVVRAVDLQQAVDAAPEVKMDFSKNNQEIIRGKCGTNITQTAEVKAEGKVQGSKPTVCRIKFWWTAG